DTTAYEEGYYLADSIEAVSTICSKTTKAGAKILNCLSAEDVLLKYGRVCGLVLNWSAVEVAHLHVDPISIKAKFVVDATGHSAEVVKIVEKKSGIKLKTKTGKILGEQPMWAEVAEETILKNTKEVCPGLYVCGMSANAVFGGPRMGPIFGGMLLSGKRLADIILKKIRMKGLVYEKKI
ncbi:MAG: sulfide-dependent adenosine diphosphate thiazole synthase, partial [Candidatus Omnitrophica bacterium]|nr:sulfide-dependent adenosine diphosphate thiazole synthase [Candidatus Omnitrophota bacterium]